VVDKLERRTGVSMPTKNPDIEQILISSQIDCKEDTQELGDAWYRGFEMGLRRGIEYAQELIQKALKGEYDGFTDSNIQ
jgi:hypothetical protein